MSIRLTRVSVANQLLDDEFVLGLPAADLDFESGPTRGSYY